MPIRDYLQSRNVWFQMFLHPPGPCSTRLAQSAHVSGRRVAKGVLVRAGTSYVLAVLPATCRVDLVRLSQVVGVVPLDLASEEEAVRVFGDCERGALPPFGRLYGLTTVVDTSLAASAEIVCVGNHRHEGFRLRYRDYEAIETPIRARFASPVCPRRKRLTHRKAG